MDNELQQQRKGHPTRPHKYSFTLEITEKYTIVSVWLEVPKWVTLCASVPQFLILALKNKTKI